MIMNHNKLYSSAPGIVLLTILLTLLTGCVSTSYSDLENKVDKIMARPGGRIEPLPEVKPYEAYTYHSAENNAKDPFHPFFEKTQEEVAENQDSGLTEEMEREIRNRNREELESYELDSLRMVGTLEDAEENWGIVLDPDGTVHKIKVGNYLGQNIGKITNIFEDKIELREIIQNSQGRWEEREAALALSEE